ncbi:hypothetical protein THAOC_24557, partial [Thalassiosira oceanica]
MRGRAVLQPELQQLLPVHVVRVQGTERGVVVPAHEAAGDAVRVLRPPPAGGHRRPPPGIRHQPRGTVVPAPVRRRGPGGLPRVAGRPHRARRGRGSRADTRPSSQHTLPDPRRAPGNVTASSWL